MIGNMKDDEKGLRVKEKKIKKVKERMIEIGDKRREIILKKVKELIEGLIGEKLIKIIIGLVGKKMKVRGIVVKEGDIRIIEVVKNIMKGKSEMMIIKEEGEECVKKKMISILRIGRERRNLENKVLGIEMRRRNGKERVEV